jgi:hypothetical protein
VIGWELAARIWHQHAPGGQSALPDCAFCRGASSCPVWQFVDGFLIDALAPMRAVLDDPTRELPVVRILPLPRRRPGAELAASERYEGWFYTLSVTLEQRQIWGGRECRHCSLAVVRNGSGGWLHSDGWYACRNLDGSPRPFMAEPAEGQP